MRKSSGFSGDRWRRIEAAELPSVGGWQATSGMQTFATFVFNQFVQGSPGLGMALSVLAIFSSTAILVAVSRFSRAAAA